jgi:hypothetical protein
MNPDREERLLRYLRYAFVGYGAVVLVSLASARSGGFGSGVSWEEAVVLTAPFIVMIAVMQVLVVRRAQRRNEPGGRLPQNFHWRFWPAFLAVSCAPAGIIAAVIVLRRGPERVRRWATGSLAVATIITVNGIATVLLTALGIW